MTEPTRKVLTALLDDPTRERYGLDLSKQATVAPGTMYGVLDRLAGWEWVESRIVYPADLAAPPRRYYRLTRDGAARAQAALAHADHRRRPTRRRATLLSPADGQPT